MRLLLAGILLSLPLLAGAQASFVNLAGDTMTGPLNITLNGGQSNQTLLSLFGPMEVASDKPIIILRSTLSTRQWQLRNGGLNPGGSSFDIFDATAGKSRLILDGGGNVSIGTGATALNSRLYVWGGPTGANIDVRGDPATDQATIELEGNNYDRAPNSVRLQYYGANNTFGTTMGFPNNKLGVLAWGNAATALIDVQNPIPLIFGINDKDALAPHRKRRSRDRHDERGIFQVICLRRRHRQCP